VSKTTKAKKATSSGGPRIKPKKSAKKKGKKAKKTKKRRD
jgi:hypothetical protein